LTRTDNSPEAGDIILKFRYAPSWPTLYDEASHATLIETRRLTSPGIVHLLNPVVKAGFYSTAWGILPFGLSCEPDRDYVRVYRVLKKYEGPIPRPEQEAVDPSYVLLREKIQEIAHQQIEEGAFVLVVSKGDDELLRMLGRGYRHFPQSESGAYRGYYPADDEEAMAHLTMLHSQGARYILFPETSRWWLLYYRSLDVYLRTQTRTVFDIEGLGVAFQLTGPE